VNNLRIATLTGVLTALISFHSIGWGAAVSNPESLRVQADNNVQAAGMLLNQAQILLNSANVTREKMKIALNLYIQAGQMFEQSANIYKALLPNYASQEDVLNADGAMKGCLRSIGEIKSKLGN
jgi:hypothetical protein